METGTVNTRISGHIATITFAHPASNAFPSAQLKKLADTFTLVGNNPDVHVIVLKSEGEKAFCAGASFNELLAVSSFEGGAEFFSGFANVINAMRTCPKLVIGRIQGKAVGGGVGLAAACDYCFATEAASIKLSEFTIGIGPFVIAPAVERKMGKAALAELTLAADEWKSAGWAASKGLFSSVYKDIPEMDEAVEVFVTKLASYNPEALNAMKRVLWEGTENWDALLAERARISGGLVLSDFTKAALQQFK